MQPLSLFTLFGKAAEMFCPIFKSTSKNQIASPFLAILTVLTQHSESHISQPHFNLVLGFSKFVILQLSKVINKSV